MAKSLGSLVGVLIAKAGFAGVSPFLKTGVDKVLMRDSVTLAVAGAVGDQISLGFFQSAAMISQGSALYFDGSGANVTASIGDKNYPAALLNGQSVAAKGSCPLMGALACNQMFQPLWKMLGYPADPGGMIELLLTFAGAGPAANAGFSWTLSGGSGC